MRPPTRKVPMAAVALSLLLSLGTQPVQADPPVRGSEPPSTHRGDPLTPLTAGNPSEFLARDAAGKILPNARGLQPLAAEILSQAARTLNEASAAGYLSVARDFSSVDVTEAGRDHVHHYFDESSAGCYRVAAVSADWLGFHVALETACTDDEFAERLGLPSPSDDSVDAQGIMTLASYSSGESEPVISASHGIGNTCAGTLASYATGLIGFAVMATSPAGWAYWIGVSAAGVGTTMSYFSVMDACFSVHKVQWRYRAGSYEYKKDCKFHSNWNYRYTNHGIWAPFSERWNCGP
jgi:hypothetical protein